MFFYSGALVCCALAVWLTGKEFNSISVWQDFKGRVGGVTVNPVDTTGAGDGFVGGLLYCLASDPNLYKVL